MTKVYLIEGYRGYWDDAVTYILEAYTSKEAAEKRVIELNEELKIKRATNPSHLDKYLLNPVDLNFPVWDRNYDVESMTEDEYTEYQSFIDVSEQHDYQVIEVDLIK